MVLLQLPAARMAAADRLVFHGANPARARLCEKALRILEDELSSPSKMERTADVIRRIEAMRFAWGVSDGT